MAFIKAILLFLRKIFVLPIRFYQKFISPVIHARQSSCRYHPGCSQYTKESILKHGILLGMILGITRVLRCHGLFSGGHDPVPEKFTFKYIGQSYRKFWGKGRDAEPHEHDGEESLTEPQSRREEG